CSRPPPRTLGRHLPPLPRPLRLLLPPLPRPLRLLLPPPQLLPAHRHRRSGRRQRTEMIRASRGPSRRNGPSLFVNRPDHLNLHELEVAGVSMASPVAQTGLAAGSPSGAPGSATTADMEEADEKGRHLGEHPRLGARC